MEHTEEYTTIVSIYIPHDNQMIEVEPHWINLMEIATRYSFLKISFDEYVATVNIPVLKIIDDAYRQHKNDVNLQDIIAVIENTHLTDDISVSVQIVTFHLAEIIKNAPRFF